MATKQVPLKYQVIVSVIYLQLLSYHISLNRMHALYLFQCFDIACTIQGHIVFKGTFYFLLMKYPGISVSLVYNFKQEAWSN